MDPNTHKEVLLLSVVVSYGSSDMGRGSALGPASVGVQGRGACGVGRLGSESRVSGEVGPAVRVRVLCVHGPVSPDPNPSHNPHSTQPSPYLILAVTLYPGMLGLGCVVR